MKEIKLSKEMVTLVDEEDYEWLNQWKWCVCKIGNNYYATRNVKNKGTQTSIRMHRLIMDAQKGVYVDHVDIDSLNNQRYNLRICTNAQNAMNQKKVLRDRFTSKYKGVSWHKSNKRWCANITINRKSNSLGSFKCETRAALAYDKKAKEIFKEYARTNIIT